MPKDDTADKFAKLLDATPDPVVPPAKTPEPAPAPSKPTPTPSERLRRPSFALPESEYRAMNEALGELTTRLDRYHQPVANSELVRALLELYFTNDEARAKVDDMIGTGVFVRLSGQQAAKAKRDASAGLE